MTPLPSAVSCPQGARTKDLPEAPVGCPGPRSSCPANAATEPTRHAWSAERMLGTPTLAAHENHVGSVSKSGRAGCVRVNVFLSFSGDPESTLHLGIGGLDRGQFMPDVTLMSPPDRSRPRTLTPTQPFRPGVLFLCSLLVCLAAQVHCCELSSPGGVHPDCHTPRAISRCPPPTTGSALPRMSLSFSRVPMPPAFVRTSLSPGFMVGSLGPRAALCERTAGAQD